MCVTNTAYRRTQPISLEHQNALSMAQQNLLSAFAQQQVCPLETQQTHSEKPRVKRRRKPQKPGKTAKLNDRHFVVHDYHDHANDLEDQHDLVDEEEHGRRGGVATAFPIKLHSVLAQVERDGLAHVISWQVHGRCFVIHEPKQFVEYVMPKYFRQSKLTSFQRQLNLYGFSRLTRGEDAGGYYNELFLRGREFLCKRMTRTKVKGTRYKAASSPEQEPNFYKMPYVTGTYGSASIVSNHDEEMSYDSSYRATLPVSNSLYEPISVDFTNAPAPLNYGFVQQQQPLYQQINPMPLSAANNDRALDEAVNEMFFAETNGNSDPLADFVNSWGSSFNLEEEDNLLSEDRPIENDTDLGFLLEKLLSD